MKQALRFTVPAYLLLEAFLTLAVASWLCAAPILLLLLLLLLLGTVAGATILRREKLAMLARLRQTMAADEPILPGMFDNALRAMAGVLLIVPGLISDALAAGLLIPEVRRFLIRRLATGFGLGPEAGPVVIEDEYRNIDDKALPGPKRRLQQS